MSFSKNKINGISPENIITNHIEHSCDKLMNASCELLKNHYKSIELDAKLMEQLNK